MNKTSKIWGTSIEIVTNPFVEMHHIYIKPSSYCSEHMHRFKTNAFYCLHGSVVVEVWKENGLMDKTILGPGDSTSVPPGEKHQFSTLKLADIKIIDPSFNDNDQVEVIELYYPESINKEDIQRSSQGGSLYSV